VGLSEVFVEQDMIYWMETRPEHYGRRTVVAHRNRTNIKHDVTSGDFDVGTRVYEYGGGSYTVVDGELFFSNFDDMKVYRQRRNSKPSSVTSNNSRFRYADFIVDKTRNCIFCVREEHGLRHRDVINTLVTIPLDRPGKGTVISTGNDFYLSPKLSPDRSTLAWVAWDFPNMPWDETELWTAKVGRHGALGRRVRIAGGSGESVLQPEWAPDGTLYFVSDRSGWWNIFRFRRGRVENMHKVNAEFGEPQWQLGLSSYAVGLHHLVCSYIRGGRYRLAIINLENKRFDSLEELPFTKISYVRADGETVAFLASNSSSPSAIVRLDLSSRDWSVLRRSSETPIQPHYLSVPKTITFPTARSLTAYAFYYPPKNKDYRPRKGEKPPLIVKVHGGPTSATSVSFDLQIHFFTSRGFAVLDINYGGSTGYGRKYRERLNGMWGVIDVEDCANGAKFICDQGRADRRRLLIRGGSAGGFTTLASLAFKKLYRAGACYYGISDLETWARDTHKFESRYLDRMIGPHPSKRGLYLKRSPARFAERISSPLLIFQGLDDKVVPPTQSRVVVDRMRRRRLPVRYLEFEGEGHGFHAAEHIAEALQSELCLYTETLGLRLADDC
jgi:dipeptidyl aminopeptidase/acylaminoacyl peptidase